MTNPKPQQPQTQLAQNAQQPPANQLQQTAQQQPEQVGQQAQQAQQAQQQAFNAMPANSQSMISFNTTAPEQMQAQQAPASYQSIIDQQNEQIAALIAQNQALNGQITKMVQNGAQFYQPQQPQPAQVGNMPQYQNAYGGVANPAIVQQPQPQNPMQQFNPPALSSNQDWSLEALGKEIGKPRKEV